MSDLRVGIIGTGYVGLVSGACFADLGFKVSCLDIVPKKVEMINKAIPPIFENGLEELLHKVVLEEKLLTATLNRREVLENSDLIFFSLATPSGEDGSIDLEIMKDECKAIGEELRTISDYKVFVVKSTVIPGTTDGVIKELLEENSGKKAGIDFGLAMNPEFLMEGLAISNFKKPDRIVIGAIDEKSFGYVAKLYDSFTCEILNTSPSAAEMIKYASNSFLALKVSFINEIANLSEKLGVNVGDVAKGIGLDERISSRFLRAGIGFGGSCFPKDVKALNYLSQELGMPSKILPSVLDVNKKQPLRAIELLENLIDLKGKSVALLGLAFKPETDDMRDGPSIIIANELRKRGITVKGYDPIAKESAKQYIPDIIHCDSVKEVLEGVDATILVTEWDEFKSLKPDDFSVMKGNVIVDGRRILDWKRLSDAGYKIKVIGQSEP